MLSKRLQQKVDGIVKEIDKGIKTFGTYDLFDKGLDEVFDSWDTVQEMKKEKPKDIQKMLLELAKHECGEPIVSGLIYEFDDMNEFEEIIDHKDLEGYL